MRLIECKGRIRPGEQIREGITIAKRVQINHMKRLRNTSRSIGGKMLVEKIKIESGTRLVTKINEGIKVIAYS